MAQHSLAPSIRPAEANILAPFLAISFGLTWGLAALLFVAYDQITALFGEVSTSNPLFVLAVYAPLIASTIMVWARFGYRNLGAFFRRALLVRASRWWWAFIIVGIPLVMYAGAAIKGTATSPGTTSSLPSVPSPSSGSIVRGCSAMAPVSLRC